MAGARLRRHDQASQTHYQELKQLARSQKRILSGTPGTLKHRTQSGKRYWVREYIRVDGKKTDEYIGPESSVGKERIESLAAEIDLARTLAAGSAKLRLLAYQRIDRKPAAVLEVFYNRGLNEAGLVLVGSHAYGILLNELGVSAPGYRTQDIDIARAQPLTIALGDGIRMEQLLNETGLTFVPVPGMPSHRPSASFKLPGADTLAVDLLVPGDRLGEVVPVKELGAHAQAVPHLGFLVRDPIGAVAISPNQVIPVKVPSPERFLLHKLFSSQARRTDRDKARKDLEQAAILAAAVEDDRPGELRDAFRRLPADAKPTIRRGARAAAAIVEPMHSEAHQALLELAKTVTR
jgi:hypothetical protein